MQQQLPSPDDNTHASSSNKQQTSTSKDDETNPEPPRLRLACLPCRSKKAKCNGDRPSCAQCTRMNLACKWPAGRARKRTRIEMELEHGTADGSIMTGKQRRKRSIKPGENDRGEGSSTGLGVNNPGQTRSEAASSASPSNQVRSTTSETPPTQPYIPPIASIPSSAQSNAQDLAVQPNLMEPMWDSFAFDPFPDIGSIDVPPRSLPPELPSHIPPSWLVQPDISVPGNNLSESPNTTQKRTQEQIKTNTILEALVNPVGFVEGKPDEAFLRVYYYRVAGSTAINPGINRICLKLRLKTDLAPDLSYNPNQFPFLAQGPFGPRISSATPVSSSATIEGGSLFDNITFDAADLPEPAVYEPLLGIFWDVACQHFPSIQKTRINRRLADGTMSAFLLASLCAYSARFSLAARGNPVAAGNVFMKKAAELLVPLLSLPTTDGVTGLLVLAWVQYGQNSESGFWHYAGLAIRMAEDIGIHKNIEAIYYEDPGHRIRARLLFWSLFLTDRLLAWSTGRQCTINENLVEVPLPTDSDLIPCPLPDGYSPNETPSPFVYCLRISVVCGRISDLLNGNRGVQKTFATTSDTKAEAKRLSELQHELVTLYNALPPCLTWSANNFKALVSEKTAGIYLTLHCIANATLASLYHPAILRAPNGAETPFSSEINRSLVLAVQCSRIISECMVYADLCSPMSFIATPHITQAVYTAGLAFVHEIHSNTWDFTANDPEQNKSPKSGQTTDRKHIAGSQAFFAQIAQQNLDVVMKALKKLETVWAGAGVNLYVLRQRAKGLSLSNISVENSSEEIPTFVHVPDSGILRRFTGAIGGSSGSQPSPSQEAGVSPYMRFPGGDQFTDENSLEQLLARYAIDDFSVEAAGMYQDAIFRALQTGTGFQS